MKFYLGVTGSPYLIKPGFGQGAFKVLAADAYTRRCAVTGEKNSN